MKTSTLVLVNVCILFLLRTTYTRADLADLTNPIDQHACRQMETKLLPLLNEAQTYGRISFREKKVHPEMLKLVGPIREFANQINDYLYALGSPIDPVFALKTESTDQIDGYRYSEAGPDGHCLELEFRNKTYNGRWCGPLRIVCTKRYVYDAYCVRKLKPEHVEKFNHALQLRNTLKKITRWGAPLESYEYVFRIEEMLNQTQSAITNFCSTVKSNSLATSNLDSD